MAASTDDILTLAQLKAELRIPLETTSQDDLLRSQIASGISLLSHDLPAPLLDESKTVSVAPGTGQNPVAFAASGLREITEIKYWTPAVTLRDAPDGTIAGSDLGRVHRGDRRSASVYPPAIGWPNVLRNSYFEIVYISGLGGTPPDETRIAQVSPVAGAEPLSFAASGLKSVTAVKFWTPAGALRSDPDGTIGALDLGRLVVGATESSIYPPLSGWPMVLADSLMRIVYLRHGTASGDIAAFRGALVCYIRHVYDGFREVRPTESFVRLSRGLGR